MKRIGAVVATLALSCLVAEARPVKRWSPQELYDRSDAIVIATAVSIEKTEETGQIQLANHPPDPVITCKARLLVKYVIKGKDLKEAEFRYCPLDWARVGNKPLVNPPGRIGLEKNALYVIYLKKQEQAGRTFFVGALEGEYDDGQAAVRIASQSAERPQIAELREGSDGGPPRSR